jgi:protein polybromo-1
VFNWLLILLFVGQSDQCQQLYDIIRAHKKEDGTLLCEAFIRMPKRRQEPAYYEVVSNPMDMLKIQQKIKTEEYDDVDQMSADVDLMLANAKAFYKKSSQEYKDACDLWDLFAESKFRLFDKDEEMDEGGKGKIILKMGKLVRRTRRWIRIMIRII